MKYRKLTPKEADAKFSRNGYITMQFGNGLKRYNIERVYRSGNVALLKLDAERSYEIVESPEGQLFLQFGTYRYLIYKILNSYQSNSSNH